MGMIHVTHFIIWQWSLQGVFPSKQSCGSISQSLVVLKSCCSGVLLSHIVHVTHPGRWFVTREDGGRRKKKLKVWARSICACNSLVSDNAWDRTTWTASPCWQLITGRHEWISQDSLNILSPSWQLQMWQLGACSPLPVSRQKMLDHIWRRRIENGASLVVDMLWLKTRLTNIWQEWKDILSYLCNLVFPLLFSYNILPFYYLQLLYVLYTSDVL